MKISDATQLVMNGMGQAGLKVEERCQERSVGWLSGCGRHCWLYNRTKDTLGK